MVMSHMYIMMQASILITLRKHEFNYTSFTSSRKRRFLLYFSENTEQACYRENCSELLSEFLRPYVIKFQVH
jgi:hypothetical protein